MPDRAWYYSSGGQQHGPINTAQLKQLATSGQLQPTDLVWTDSMANWSPANSVKGLFPATAVASPAAAPVAATTEIEPAAAAPTTQPPADTHYAEQYQAAKDFARQASREAAGAFKSLARDPVGGIGQSFRQFSNKTAMQVGGAFLVLFVLLVIAASFIGGVSMLFLGITMSTGGAKEFFVGLLAVLAMMAAMIGVVALFRTLTRSGVGLAADLFIVGASLLPMGFFFLLSSLLNGQSRVVLALVMALLVFAMSFTALMLYSGFTQILRLSERLASLAVPSMFVAGGAASSLIAWLFS